MRNFKEDEVKPGTLWSKDDNVYIASYDFKKMSSMVFVNIITGEMTEPSTRRTEAMPGYGYTYMCTSEEAINGANIEPKANSTKKPVRKKNTDMPVFGLSKFDTKIKELKEKLAKAEK